MFDRKSSSLSYQNAAASFLLQLMNLANPDTLIEIQPKVVRLVHKLALYRSGGGDVSSSYVYFDHANPWLQMKLYKALQLWSVPMEKGILTMIEEVLSKVLKKVSSSKSINKNNTEYGLLFEVINVIIHYDKSVSSKLSEDVSKILVVFITSSQANIRYLGLEAMCRLALKQNLATHLEKILPNLDDKDISIRRRALDLLYLICNHQNVSKIVAELLGYLEARNDPLMRDDLVLKIAILAEMFAENLIWYVDVVVKLIQNAEVENDIWYRIIQIITGIFYNNLGFGTANK
jgi:AP-2 complex subunit alpha